MKPLPLATALQESLENGYSFRTFMHDLGAAVVVSLVALPLAMALSIAIGLPPQYGIYTAIVAGILTPLLGGSIMQVSGPTAAFVVILAPIVAEFGLRGIIIAELMAGLILVLLAWAKLGRFISFVPYPVTTGFTSGIAVVIATLSLNDLLGLGIPQLEGSYVEKLGTLLQYLPNLHWPDVVVGLASLTVMFTGKYITRRVPSAVLGIGVGTLLSYLFSQINMGVATINSRFDFQIDEGLFSMALVPKFHWFSPEEIFAWPQYSELTVLFMPAVAIAALAALESLLSATVADGMARTRHKPNAELWAIGISNIASAFASGVPATGAIARTTTNIKSGARTPIASSLHGVLILLYVGLFPKWIGYLPMASLAALLMLTAYNMSHYQQFIRILRIAHKQDVAVLLVCFGLTVFVDMVAGVTVGILLAALLFIQRVSAMAESSIEESTNDAGEKLPANVMLYHMSGPLFFATVERTLDRTAFLRSRIDTLIIDMLQVPLIDMSGLVGVKNLLTSDVLTGKRIILCAKQDILSKILQKMAGEGVIVETATSVDEAIAKAA